VRRGSAKKSDQGDETGSTESYVLGEKGRTLMGGGVPRVERKRKASEMEEKAEGGTESRGA